MSTLRSRLAGLRERALDTVLVPRCLACEREGAYICAPCLAKVGTLSGNVTPWAKPSSGNDPCLLDHIFLDAVYIPFAMDGVIRQAILQLKYRDLQVVAPPLADLLAGHARASALVADVIVPVPLHTARLRERGYNQADLLARRLSTLLQIPCQCAALARTRQATPQARTGSLAKRANNVRGAFEPRASMAGQRVLLIDDVSTTGATLNACAEALKVAGALTVVGLTVAHEL